MIKNKFHYLPKRWMMNLNEYRFFKILNSFIGSMYVVVPQVHLDDLVNVFYNNQHERLLSFRHINQKSVDFVICDKKSMRPLLVIELDDKSHEKEERKDRDLEVERILKESGLNILRVLNKKHFDKEEIERLVLEKLK